MAPMPAAASPKLTYEDYCTFPDDGQRHELIDGEHCVTPSPLDVHQCASANLTTDLTNFLRTSKLGVLREAPSDVQLSDHDVVQPDLYVVLREHFDRRAPRGMKGPPDLVIEILSPSRPEYDLVQKRRLYERAGVTEYWVVDPALQRVEVYRRDGAAGYLRPALLLAEQGDVLATPLLPGLALPVAGIFQDP